MLRVVQNIEDVFASSSVPELYNEIAAYGGDSLPLMQVVEGWNLL